MRLLLKGARIWDGEADGYQGADVLCVDGRIAEVGDVKASADRVIELPGKTILPGLIDAHFHAYASEVNIPHLETLPLSYLAHHASALLGGALRRGFTTVRDAGGADWGLWRAVEDGLVLGPRIFYAGRALSQTGGHGDTRPTHQEPCGCRHVANLSQVADGVDAVRAAARECLRRGAHQIKIFVSGGVSSPSDPISMRQYSAEEIRAVVDEASRRDTYVMAHAYGADAIIHAVENGVRSIEHGNLIDEAAARLMAERGAFLVPTLITYEALADAGAELGLAPEGQRKLQEVRERGAKGLIIARNAGVSIGFGTDLLGVLHARQLEEFRIRSQLEPAIDTLRSATSVNARLLNRTGELGVLRPGALADLIAVDGDPLADLSALYSGGPRLVVKAGQAVAGDLAS